MSHPRWGTPDEVIVRSSRDESRVVRADRVASGLHTTSVMCIPCRAPLMARSRRLRFPRFSHFDSSLSTQFETGNDLSKPWIPGTTGAGSSSRTPHSTEGVRERWSNTPMLFRLATKHRRCHQSHLSGRSGRRWGWQSQDPILPANPNPTEPTIARGWPGPQTRGAHRSEDR